MSEEKATPATATKAAKKASFSIIDSVVKYFEKESKEELAENIKEGAIAAYESTIPGQAVEIQLKKAIKDAQKNLDLARINQGREVSDYAAYIENVRAAKKNLAKAEAQLAANKELVAELKAELELIK